MWQHNSLFQAYQSQITLTYLVSSVVTFVFQLTKNILVSKLLILSIPDEDYSRNLVLLKQTVDGQQSKRDLNGLLDHWRDTRRDGSMNRSLDSVVRGLPVTSPCCPMFILRLAMSNVTSICKVTVNYLLEPITITLLTQNVPDEA